MKTRHDAIAMDDLEDEKEILIEWKDYEIDTLITIRIEVEEEFAKSTRKQGT